MIIIDKWFYVPLNFFDLPKLIELKDNLTVKSKFLKQDKSGNEYYPVLKAFDESKEGYIGLPIRFGIDSISLYINKNFTINDTTFINNLIEFPKLPPRGTRKIQVWIF